MKITYMLLIYFAFQIKNHAENNSLGSKRYFRTCIVFSKVVENKIKYYKSNSTL